MGRYQGKVCEKHPALNGARLESSKKCVGCHGERVLAFKKTPAQRDRLREYSRTQEQKGSPSYEAKKARNRRWYRLNAAWFKVRNQQRKGLGGNFVGYDEHMKALYRKRPEGFHVDHVIPLKGISRGTKQHVVCGLHVPWNLQYLPGDENDRKWAWFDQ